MPEETTTNETVETSTSQETVAEKPWHETVAWNPSEYEPSDKIREFKSIPDLAKSYDSLRVDNSKKIKIPGEKATLEEQEAFKSTLKSYLGQSAPESPDKYSFKAPEGMEEYFSDLGDQLKSYHEAGLGDETVSLILGQQADAIKSVIDGMAEKQQQIAEESEKALRAELGSDYDKRMSAVNNLKNKYKDVFDDLTAVGLANSLPILKMLDDVARSVREDSPLGLSTASVSDAKTKLAQIKAQPKTRAEREASPYYNGSHPDHAATMAEVRHLQRQIVAGNI